MGGVSSRQRVCAMHRAGADAVGIGSVLATLHRELFPRVIGFKLYAGHSTGRMGVTDVAGQVGIWKALSTHGYRGVVAVHAEREDLLRLARSYPASPAARQGGRLREHRTFADGTPCMKDSPASTRGTRIGLFRDRNTIGGSRSPYIAYRIFISPVASERQMTHSGSHSPVASTVQLRPLALAS